MIMASSKNFIFFRNKFNGPIIIFSKGLTFYLQREIPIFFHKKVIPTKITFLKCDSTNQQKCYHLKKRRNLVVSAMASGVRGPGFDPRPWRGTFGVRTRFPSGMTMT